MSKIIDRAGTFTGTITESTLGQSSNGYPQFVARIHATKKYVNTPEEREHFKITEDGYVDWSPYDEDALAYLVLFTDKGPLKNYDQLMAATGWDGTDFQDLTGFVGKTILFRVEEDNYNNKISYKINWIDAENAPPERTLKSVDPSKIADLNAKFLANMKKPQAPAKPATAAKAAVAAPKPAVVSTPVTPSREVAAPAAVSSTTPTATGKAPPSRKAKTPPVPPAVTEGIPAGLPEETTQIVAWEYLNDPAVRGNNDEGVVAEAWMAACSEVGENVDESKFTPAMWAKVRNVVLKDLGVTK